MKTKTPRKTFCATATLKQLRAFAVTCWISNPLTTTLLGSWVYLSVFREDKRRGPVDLHGEWLSGTNAPKPLMTSYGSQPCQGFPSSQEYGFRWESHSGDKVTAVPILGTDPAEGIQYNVECQPAEGDTCQYMAAFQRLGVEWAEAVAATAAAELQPSS